MRTRLFGWRGVGFATAPHALMALWIAAVIVSLVDSVSGQGREAPSTIRLQPSAGKAAEPPKRWAGEFLPDGQPNVQGRWGSALIEGSPGGTYSLTNPIPTNTDFGEFVVPGQPPVRSLPSRIVDPPDGQVPYQPWAAARKKRQEFDLEHPTRPEHLDTQHRCLVSIPRLYYFPQFRIVQPAGSVVFLWEGYHQYRVIPVDGSPHIGPTMKLWMGDARGRWEGNTLVVDTTNHNGKTRLTSGGDFFSQNVHLVERFTFVDANTMNYEVMIEDPTVFTRPWTMRVAQKRAATDDEMWESACHEGVNRPGATREDDRILLPPERKLDKQ